MQRRYLYLLLLSLLALVTACGGQSAASTTTTGLNVVTTIGQIADVVRNVGGDYVTVASLMGPGVDPHLYVASASDVDRLARADIVFYNGLFLEARMENILEQLPQAVAVSKDIDPANLLPSPLFPDEHDPHIWFDVTLWARTVRTVRDSLSAQAPDQAATFEANAAAYLAQLEQLHQYVLSQAVRVSAEKRVLITAHDAFNYFGRAYSFQVMGLQGISTASEASSADVQALAEFIAQNQIPAIFIESSVPVRNIEAVRAAVVARSFDVAIGGQLFSDAMGDQGTSAGTYIGMVTYNIDTIVGALLGNQP